MIYAQGNIFDRLGHVDELVCITTNSKTDRYGNLIMGAGIALEAANRFPGLPAFLGTVAKVNERYLVQMCPNNIVAIQTKIHWKDPSEMVLLDSMLYLLSHLFRQTRYVVNLPRPGCGLGGLDWETQVKPLCEEYLSTDNFVIWSKA